MNHFEEQLGQQAGELSLTPAEKTAMGRELSLYMSSNPLTPAARPWLVRSTWLRFAAPAVAVVLLFSSTAYAAQGALPGDVLYPVKVNVTEAVAGALAVSPAAKASWNASVAQVRVQEAQQLAAQGTLNASTTQELQSNFDAHAAAAASYAREVAATNPQDGAQLQSQLSVMSAQGAVLAAIGSESKSEEVRASSQNFAASIQAAAAASSTTLAATSTTERAHAQFRARADTADTAAAAHIKTEALQQLSQVESAYAALSTSTTASTTAALDARVAAARALIEQGDTASSSGEALAHYTQALTSGAVLQTYLQASSQFNGGILSPLLNARQQEQSDSFSNQNAVQHAQDRQNESEHRRER